MNLTDFEHSVQADVPLHIYCLINCGQSCMEKLYNYGFIVSVVFTVAACLVSLYNILMHFINFNNPFFQSKIITILLMPPIYCVTSTLAFMSIKYAAYFTLFRDFYQIVGLFAFIILIFSFLAFNHDKNELEEKKVYEIMMSQAKEVPHDFPCSYFQKPYQLSNWIKAKYFTYRCMRAIIQYILVKIVTTIFLALVYPNYELRDRLSDDWDYQVYQYVNTGIYWIATISSYIAFYYLGLFYNTLQQPLKPFNPDLKFVTLNTTLFYTYWQKVFLVIFQNDILSCFDSAAPSFNSKKIMYCIQNTLICFEMLCMSFAGAEAYNYENYVVRGRKSYGSFTYIFKDIMNIFKKQLRLVKPPKIMGFSTEADKSQMELHILGQSRTQKGGCSKHVRQNIENKVIEDYF